MPSQHRADTIAIYIGRRTHARSINHKMFALLKTFQCLFAAALSQSLKKNAMENSKTLLINMSFQAFPLENSIGLLPVTQQPLDDSCTALPGWAGDRCEDGSAYGLKQGRSLEMHTSVWCWRTVRVEVTQLCLGMGLY